MPIELARGNEVAATASKAPIDGSASAGPEDRAAGSSFGAVLASIDAAPPAAGTGPAMAGSDANGRSDAATAAGKPDAAATADAGATGADSDVALEDEAQARRDRDRASAQRGAGESAEASTLLLAQSTLTVVAVDAAGVERAAPTVSAPADAARRSVTGDARAVGIGATPVGAAAMGANDGVKAVAGRQDLAPSNPRAMVAADTDAATPAGPRGPQAAASAAAAAASAAAADSAAAVATAGRAPSPVADAAQAASTAMTTASGALAAEGGTAWRRVAPADESPASPHGAISAADAGPAPLVAPPEAAAASAGGGGAGLAERMVEQVSWWMAHRSQGAELSIDLPGGAPVTVSVQVQDNQAQIAFRSDHPEARQWLNDAMPQLKEMLGNQGLMLSGASVGAGGQSGHEAARQAQRFAAAPEGQGPARDEPPVVAVRPRTLSQRALDLYV
ncbi:flagellar hook-length control protein FliK [Variovorax sp. J22P168]|uniref:flagellar hook-length control protein FliK n=1 Tax=Variovorax jilinensis TaxID=3053513 RepID=UPI0025774391|nr:flagellar hook-length control protein FliK [Variovorax sp. J22P168]MDM0014772.1 flagellar hook-length control protein FliK [Variovorax sp. J22P168]